jgi:hypothetical protein
MINISLRLKKIAVFIGLAIIVPWVNVGIFFTLLSSDRSRETLTFIQENEEELYTNIYDFSFLAFLGTYIIAITIINKKVNKKFLRIFYYILLYTVFFFLCCFF